MGLHDALNIFGVRVCRTWGIHDLTQQAAGDRAS